MSLPSHYCSQSTSSSLRAIHGVRYFMEHPHSGSCRSQIQSSSPRLKVSLGTTGSPLSDRSEQKPRNDRIDFVSTHSNVPRCGSSSLNVSSGRPPLSERQVNGRKRHWSSGSEHRAPPELLLPSRSVIQNDLGVQSNDRPNSNVLDMRRHNQPEASRYSKEASLRIKDEIVRGDKCDKIAESTKRMKRRSSYFEEHISDTPSSSSVLTPTSCDEKHDRHSNHDSQFCPRCLTRTTHPNAKRIKKRMLPNHVIQWLKPVTKKKALKTSIQPATTTDIRQSSEQQFGITTVLSVHNQSTSIKSSSSISDSEQKNSSGIVSKQPSKPLGAAKAKRTNESKTSDTNSSTRVSKKKSIWPKRSPALRKLSSSSDSSSDSEESRGSNIHSTKQELRRKGGSMVFSKHRSPDETSGSHSTTSDSSSSDEAPSQTRMSTSGGKMDSHAQRRSTPGEVISQSSSLAARQQQKTSLSNVVDVTASDDDVVDIIDSHSLQESWPRTVEVADVKIKVGDRIGYQSLSLFGGITKFSDVEVWPI